ncbi:dipeptidase [Alkalibacillus haloalkaliphilus]|uniref:dipeptidase n=1 Tax=Alkalibacillus haloalkaliphilus TaxID=94136 RepID=UPI0002F21A64|nr:dipeptidase [Alkalibacillus haloalkaliphilus]
MVIDMHCDALLKLWEDRSKTFDDDDLHISYSKWVDSPVKVQCFAIFVPPEKEGDYFNAALEMVDLFHEKVVKPYDNIKWVQSKEDIESLKPHEKGAMLTLEGCHVIGEDLHKLRTLLRLGIKAVGLTWNNSNAVSGTCVEKPEKGLTAFGKEVVEVLNEYKVYTDCSHLSPAGIDDVLKFASYPMFSHSNAKSIYAHDRNVSDEHLKQFFNKKAPVGLTFVPYFTAEGDEVTINDLVKHLDHLYELGGQDSIAFGSDFDGINKTIKQLEHIGDYDNLIQKVLERYSSEDVHKFSYDNFVRHLD